MSSYELLRKAYTDEEIQQIQKEQNLAVYHIVDMILKERFRARKSFGWFTTTHEALGVLREEYLELEQTIMAKYATNEDILVEAVQLATMAVCLITECLPFELIVQIAKAKK